MSGFRWPWARGKQAEPQVSRCYALDCVQYPSDDDPSRQILRTQVFVSDPVTGEPDLVYRYTYSYDSPEELEKAGYRRVG